MDEEKRQLRQTADQDFMRSLDQLEDLLEDEAIALTSLDTDVTEQSSQAHRFGGSILDAIPLANRLGDRLGDPLSAWSRAASEKAEE